MILKLLKAITKYITYRVMYPNSSIGLRCYVGNGTTLGRKTSVGTNSFIDNSTVSDGTAIGNNSYISQSTLNCQKIYDYCYISNSNLDVNTIIYSHCKISNACLERFSYISQNSTINLAKIGSFCSIGPYLICGYGQHPTNFISSHPVFYSTRKQCGVTFSNKDYYEEDKQILIGNDVWIGARVFIKDGVKIGNGAIIGAGAVVVKDVPDYAIIGGVPAKIIRFRFTDEIIQELLRIQWWNWSEEKLQKAHIHFTNPDIYSFIQFANNLE